MLKILGVTFLCLLVAVGVVSLFTACNGKPARFNPTDEIVVVNDLKNGTGTQIICCVDEKRLRTSGVSPEDLRQFFQGYFEAAGKAIADTGAEAVSGNWSSSKEHAQLAATKRGMGELLAEGIDYEIREMKNGKTVSAKQGTLQFSSQPSNK